MRSATLDMGSSAQYLGEGRAGIHIFADVGRKAAARSLQRRLEARSRAATRRFKSNDRSLIYELELPAPLLARRRCVREP